MAALIAALTERDMANANGAVEHGEQDHEIIESLAACLNDPHTSRWPLSAIRAIDNPISAS
ncbi:hypothetical protein StoSoilB5_20320 [Arthrobacter sp. StoSoilB5]|nr:hypothetical protein StoSoilB5_20320 [Arthrobacter sp. StoSoilB5]